MPAQTVRYEPIADIRIAEPKYTCDRELQPSNDIQQSLKERMIEVAGDLVETRLLLFSQLGSSIHVPFLAVLLLWIVVLLAEFSLIAPANAATLSALLICALSVSGAIFLIVELDQPFSGLMMIRSKSLRNALPPLGA